MNDAHKTILKVIFLIIVPTLIFVSWSRPDRFRDRRVAGARAVPPKLVSPPIPAVSMLPHFGDAELVPSYLWLVDDNGSIMRYGFARGQEFLNTVEGFGIGTRISFIDSKNGWAYFPDGPDGTLCWTKDGGRTWVKLPNKTGSELFIPQPRQLKFFDQKNGWLINEQNLWRTVDGGTTWTQSLLATLPLSGFKDVAFISPTTLIVAKTNGDVVMTSDAGKTWSVGDTTGLYLLTTNRQMAWGIGLDNTVFQSRDSGKTWIELSRIYSQATVLSLQFVSKSEGWAAGFEQRESEIHGANRYAVGVLFHTRDGGKTWVQLNAPSDLHFTKVAFLNSRFGWLIGFNGLYETSDSGKSWLPLIERDLRAVIE